ncbi:hypothetical protein B0T26DRAFT_743206 [Lasiosphaeria miniovina]|uniref:DUF8035 domain-containing protein n=1 Tax=Lasiosphaeria miniovina TaxID=1954250 RepID=A0AA40A615_9PEZI|nr:uncharacterized protein B0T26DRAFT_743206 [Lasiosphaeria miniovina]KAK0709902.1 hypothetical protein B0T26DRAFT_743206 [Lasiosphaeria miniovina]
MAYRSSVPDLTARGDRGDRPERWDRGRFNNYDQDRGSRFDRVERVETEEDRVYMRGANPPPRAPSYPPPRERSVERRERSVERTERRFRPGDEDDIVFRERERRVVYDDEPRMPPTPRRRPSPPESEVERRVFIDRERERVRVRSPSPGPRRPTRLVRRQSSLDTFDRHPRGYNEREEYGPPARRENREYRPEPYVPIPLPRSRALPPPRVYAERDSFEEIQISDPKRHGDEDFYAYRPERVREKEVIHTRRRTHSRESGASRGTSHHRGRSISSATSSSRSSSVSGGTTITSKSEYPKKGKTRIPSRLVSKRALIDLGYPYLEEGNVIIVQKALGQQNIDDLLKLSADYKKSERELEVSRSSPGDIIEERRTEYIKVPERQTEYIEVPERRTEYVEVPRAEYVQIAPPPSFAPTPHYSHSGPLIIAANPPPESPVEVVKTTVLREVSPARSFTTAYDTTTTTTTYETPIIYDARPREVSSTIPVGPLALAEGRRRRRSADAESLRSEINHLNRELARRDRHERHSSRDFVRAERLSTGELVLYEEEIERIAEPSRGVRLEKDKRGRLAISVPKYR